MISIIVAAALTYVVESQPPAIANQSNITFDSIGSCGDRASRVDMRRVAFLENRSIDWGAGSRRMRVRLSGENAYVQAISARVNQPVNIHSVALTVQRDGDIDIQLKFAILDGELLIYWRETYQHRMYRQGLLRPELSQLVSLCEGRGGLDSSE